MKKSILMVTVTMASFLMSCNDPTVTIEDLGNGKCKATYDDRVTIATCKDIAEYAQFLVDHDGAVISPD